MGADRSVARGWYGSLCGVLALALGWLALIGGMGWRSYRKVDKAANDPEGTTS
jgi:hypothetical protein